jgi:hypothetical protein
MFILTPSIKKVEELVLTLQRDTLDFEEEGKIRGIRRILKRHDLWH